MKIVLGYGFIGPPKTFLANRRKTQILLSNSGQVLEEKHPMTGDDTIFLHGTLSSGIPLSASLIGGKPFPGESGLDWRIYGENGQLRITSPSPFVQIGFPEMRIQLMEGEGEAKDVEIERDEFDEGGKYEYPARNVGRLYKGFAEGEINCSFEDAVERHELLDGMYKENGIVF
jgi:predicted dehydrogenase